MNFQILDVTTHHNDEPRLCVIDSARNPSSLSASRRFFGPRPSFAGLFLFSLESGRDKPVHCTPCQPPQAVMGSPRTTVRGASLSRG